MAVVVVALVVVVAAVVVVVAAGAVVVAAVVVAVDVVAAVANASYSERPTAGPIVRGRPTLLQGNQASYLLWSNDLA